MSNRKVPITRLEKFFGAEDFELDIAMGREWLEGDMNFRLVLYRIDQQKTVTDDVYGETVEDGVKFHPPVEFRGYVQIEQPENQNYGNSNMTQMEPGNLKVGVYQTTLDELEIDINYGDYIGYAETETKIKYFTVSNDGKVNADNAHTIVGYKGFYRTITCVPAQESEFRGI